MAADRPAQPLQSLRKRCEAGLCFRVIRSEWHEHADAPHAVSLLRAGGEWVRRCATESSDEIAAPHGLRSPAEAAHYYTLRENAVVHHSKIDRQMAEMGQTLMSRLSLRAPGCSQVSKRWGNRPAACG